MHSFAHHHHSHSEQAPAEETQGRVLDMGWRYDLMEWIFDPLLFRGQLRQLRQRTVDLARLQPGDQVLDVGCGTGTLAILIQQRLGPAGRVLGIDPGAQQIARARSKAARRHMPIDFRVGAIEHLPFSDQTFDVVVNTIMMHHLPDDLKRRGLSEIARVLKLGGRLVIADFAHPEDRQHQRGHFGAGGSRLQDLAALLRDAGFTQIETQQMELKQFSSFPGAGFITAYKG